MSKRYDSIIIGGGIIGLFCAYFLHQKGQSVLILNKGPVHRASSHGNCGLISPSHIVPLNSYSLILKSLGWLFRKDAPFKIKPQFDRNFIHWSIQFFKNAAPEKVYRNTRAIHDLILSSRVLYDQLLERENLACEWSTEGIHFVFKHRKGFENFRRTNAYTSGFGITARPLVEEELHRVEPSLRDDVYGSWFYDIDAWLRPDQLVLKLRDLLVNNGIEVREPEEVSNFNVSQGKIQSIQTKDGASYEADSYVLAAGAWSPLLQEELGLKLPIVPGKGYSITMKSPSICPKVPCIMAEKKVVATPWNGSYRLGSTMEFAGYDESMNQTRLQALKKSAAEYLKEPFTEEVEEEWFGWRPMTYDGVPIICRSPKQDNLFIATGHSMLGLSMATGTGKLISELILGEEPHIDAGQYAYKE